MEKKKKKIRERGRQSEREAEKVVDVPYSKD